MSSFIEEEYLQNHRAACWETAVAGAFQDVLPPEAVALLDGMRRRLGRRLHFDYDAGNYRSFWNLGEDEWHANEAALDPQRAGLTKAARAALQVLKVAACSTGTPARSVRLNALSHSYLKVEPVVAAADACLLWAVAAIDRRPRFLAAPPMPAAARQDADAAALARGLRLGQGEDGAALVLADLLDDLGCPAEAAAHLRERPRHVRGCWVVDGLLGVWGD